MTITAEQLVAIAAAHGVDLIQAAKTSANTKPKRTVQLMEFQGGRRAYVLVASTANTANGKNSPTFVRPSYTLAELGQAAQGVPDVQFWAAAYAFAGSQTYFWRLHAALCRKAFELQQRFSWPELVRDQHSLKRPYLEWLAKLTLDEDAHTNEFRVCPSLYAFYLGVTEQTWKNEIAERYFALRFVWWQWLGTAASVIQSRLAD